MSQVIVLDVGDGRDSHVRGERALERNEVPAHTRVVHVGKVIGDNSQYPFLLVSRRGGYEYSFMHSKTFLTTLLSKKRTRGNGAMLKFNRGPFNPCEIIPILAGINYFRVLWFSAGKFIPCIPAKFPGINFPY